MRNIGFFYAIASAILFGASIPLAKYLLLKINPILLAGLFYLGSGLGLLFIIFLRYILFRRKTHITRFNVNDWKWLLSACVVGGIIGPIMLMAGLAYVNASTASLLLTLEGVFTALIAWFIFKEHTDIRLIFGVILIVVASIILVLDNNFQLDHLLGVLLIAGACLAWALDNNFSRNISASDPLIIVAIKSTVAGITIVLLTFIFIKEVAIDFTSIMLSAGVGFIGYGISLILFILALRLLGTARTSAYFAIAPFIGAVFSILFLNEVISWQLIVASLLMMWGLWLHITEYHDHEHTHEPLVHSHEHIHDAHHQHLHKPGETLGEPHTHLHEHCSLTHSHPHYPDIHHRHRHKKST